LSVLLSETIVKCYVFQCNYQRAVHIYYFDLEMNRVSPVVLHEGEIWFLILREEYRSRVFENRVSRRIFGPKREELERESKGLDNKHHNL